MFVRESNSSGIIDLHAGCGQPQTFCTTTKITNVKDFTSIVLSVSWTHQALSSVKKYVGKRFGP